MLSVYSVIMLSVYSVIMLSVYGVIMLSVYGMSNNNYKTQLKQSVKSCTIKHISQVSILKFYTETRLLKNNNNVWMEVECFHHTSTSKYISLSLLKMITLHQNVIHCQGM